MDYSFFPLLVLGGFAAGFVNTLAGGGSMLTLPLLIVCGLPANVANGTNRVAILIQNISAVLAFRSKGVKPWRLGLWLALPASIGAAVGAGIAVEVDPEQLKKIFGAVLLVMCGVVFFQPGRLLKGPGTGEEAMRPGLKTFAVFFVVGLWGGFAQVGVGFLYLAGIMICADMNLVYANAAKVLVVLLFTVFSLAIFFVNGQVEIVPGLVMAVGNASGAWFASVLSVKKGAPWVRIVLIATALLAAAKLFGLLDLAWRLAFH